MSNSIAIVGGGAGGIFAALGARSQVCEAGLAVDVHLFERNPRIGIKILISGGGKCNITHFGEVEEILREGFPRVAEQRFLKPAMYRYTNAEVLALLDRHEVSWHSRENGRIFPDSGRAEDVLKAFEEELRSNDVKLHTHARVERVARLDKSWQLTVDGKLHETDVLILATGGTSYSKTGTTGDGIRYAERLGHSIVPLRPALAPIYLKRPPPQELVGIALRSVDLYVISENKILAKASGDILMTHRGLSGPAVLGISGAAALAMEESAISMAANLLSKEDATVREILVAEQQSRPQQQVNTWLEEVLPNRFVPYVLAQSDIPQDRKWNALTRDERNRLASTLNRYDFGAVSEIPLERGEVTAGGVSLKEVDPRTMMSRLVPGLFLVGEMLDIAGEIGGYNLQAAYSTGWVAGQKAVKFLGENN